MLKKKKFMALHETEIEEVERCLGEITRRVPNDGILFSLLNGLFGNTSNEMSADVIGRDGERAAHGTTLRRVLDDANLPTDAILEAFNALQSCENVLEMCCAVQEHGAKFAKLQTDAMLPRAEPPESDTHSLQIVFEPRRSRWEVAVAAVPCPDVPAEKEDAGIVRTHRCRLAHISKTLEHAESASTEIKTLRADLRDAIASPDFKSADLPNVCGLYERLIYLLQVSASEVSAARCTIGALNQQVHLCSILQASSSPEHEDDSGEDSDDSIKDAPGADVSPTRQQNIDAVLDGGDMTMLALLDITDIRLDRRQRVAVANIFAQADCMRSNSHFKEEIQRNAILGPTAVFEMERVGLFN